ncbi:MAG: transporter substrate-binding domain-containing protein [Burkholderiaceae bacterium]
MPVNRSFLLRTLLVTILGCASFTALAAGLTVGVRIIAQPYVAGAKFRTPESIETLLAKDLAARRKVPLTTVRATPANRMQLLASGKVDVVFAALADTDPLLRSTVVVSTGYSAAPLAILRSDTDIKLPQQLKGRTVCMSEGGAYVGTMAAKYGAIEKITRAPADSLLALRSGLCDAAVHDDTMLNALLKLPEWKKFSARLPLGSRTALVMIASADDADTLAFLQKTAHAWLVKNHWSQIAKKWASDVAFEVYLDQSVPDCH